MTDPPLKDPKVGWTGGCRLTSMPVRGVSESDRGVSKHDRAILTA